MNDQSLFFHSGCPGYGDHFKKQQVFQATRVTIFILLFIFPMKKRVF